MVLNEKSPQEYPVKAGVHCWFINDLPDDVICNVAIYGDDTTLYSRCDQASDLW